MGTLDDWGASGISAAVLDIIKDSTALVIDISACTCSSARPADPQTRSCWSVRYRVIVTLQRDAGGGMGAVSARRTRETVTVLAPGDVLDLTRVRAHLTNDGGSSS